jgi:dihydrofolate reductase
MAKLIYSAITSLDGYIADEEGNFDWAEPDEEVHTFVNDLERSVGTYLYGRRMYEVMVAWETMALADQQPFIQDFAEIWTGGRQDRVLQDAEDGDQRQDADRASLRPPGGRADESSSGT